MPKGGECVLLGCICAEKELLQDFRVSWKAWQLAPIEECEESISFWPQATKTQINEQLDDVVALEQIILISLNIFKMSNIYLTVRSQEL